MLTYFIVFTIVGFVIGTLVRDTKKAIPIIVAASILWGLINAPIWGLATLGELSLGFYIYLMSKNTTDAFAN